MSSCSGGTCRPSPKQIHGPVYFESIPVQGKVKGKNEGYDQYDKKNKERERDRVASVLHLFNTTPQQEQVYNNK